MWSGNTRFGIIVGAVFGLLTLFAMFMIYQGGGYHDLNFNLFPFVLFAGGFVFTSVIYYEFNDKPGTHHYLSLPASTLEKYVSKWLISAIFFPIVTVLLFWLYTKVGDYIYYRNDFYVFDGYIPWSITNWWTLFFIKIYIVIQVQYLIGAIVFQKYTYFKTSLSSFIITGVFVLLCMLAFRIIYAEYFASTFEFEDINIRPTDNAIDFLEHTFLRIIEILFWYVIPTVLLVVGFFKLKEKEA